LHSKRNKYNRTIVGSLSNSSNNPQIYKDVYGTIWEVLPWYFNILHNPAINLKLVNYDDNAAGSSEIIVKKKNVKKISDYVKGIAICDIKVGSYNFRDFHLCGHFKHFTADILPNIMYCKCVGN
jgi:hypothetical protein